MLKIGIVGLGRIGRAALVLLSKYPSKFEVVWAVDPNWDPILRNHPEVLELLKDDSIYQSLENISEPHLKASTVILNAGPHYLCQRVMTYAAELGLHYLDFTEDVIVTELAMKLGETSQSLIIPHCGLAPGAIGILGHDRWKKTGKLFGSGASMSLYVGALSSLACTMNIKHDITWSVDGLVHEYYHPCMTVSHHHKMHVPAMGEYELIGNPFDRFDDHLYEAFTTSGGLATLCDTILESELPLEKLTYKSVRYVGHHAIMKLLISELKISEADLIKIVKHSVATEDQDKVVMMIKIRNERMTHKTTTVITPAIVTVRNKPYRLTAIEYATASGACVVLDLLADWKLPRPMGFLKQEEISGELFFSSTYSKPYAELLLE